MYKESTVVSENQTHFIPCKAHMLGSKRLGKRGINLLPLKKPNQNNNTNSQKPPKMQWTLVLSQESNTFRSFNCYGEVSNFCIILQHKKINNISLLKKKVCLFLRHDYNKAILTSARFFVGKTLVTVFLTILL